MMGCILVRIVPINGSICWECSAGANFSTRSENSSLANRRSLLCSYILVFCVVISGVNWAQPLIKYQAYSRSNDFTD